MDDYATASLADYTRYGGPHYQKKRPGVGFKSSDTPDGFVCQVLWDRRISCQGLDPQPINGTGSQIGCAESVNINAEGVISVSSGICSKWNPQRAAEWTANAMRGYPTLPESHKLVIDHMEDPRGALSDEEQAVFSDDPVVCGTGKYGAVNCDTGNGHGFELFRFGYKIW